MHSNILSREKTALVIVDFQEAFRETIPGFDRVATNISNAASGFRVLGLPIIVTEQYPKGLGHTAKEVLNVLPEGAPVLEKTAFSSCGAKRFLEELKGLNVSQVLLCGLETHICVNQTAHDLLDENFDVHILEDAVGSRRESDRQSGLEKMKAGGAKPSCVEMALFELLRDSKHENFREIQSLIK